MKRRYIYSLFAIAAILSTTACDDYLNVMPDNRATLDKVDEVYAILTSAYPEYTYALDLELASDNTDCYRKENPNGDRFLDQCYGWIDQTETGSDSFEPMWDACYKAIANANLALEAAEAIGGEEVQAAIGEALMARAYAHWILVSTFCMPYDPKYSSDDLGIKYVDRAGGSLTESYDRMTVAEVYERIAEDIERGLPLVDDSHLKVPKYHMNVRAAYTFAARFYLFYGDWDRVIEYATAALGSNPEKMLRDYVTLAAMPHHPLENVATAYTKSSETANFLLQAEYSTLGLVFGGTYTCGRYNHGNLLATTETMSSAPWGARTSYYYYQYVFTPARYLATDLDKTLVPRFPILAEYTDPVAGIGYWRTVHAAIKAEEALLSRAEAFIMKDQYELALADMNKWIANTCDPTYVIRTNLTQNIVRVWAANLDYYTPTAPTPKKHLNFALIPIKEGSIKEAMIHAVLYMRRFEFMHEGMRWFDLNRYGIKIYRRTIDSDGLTIAALTDSLEVRDERRAQQLPQKIISTGVTPNPRTK